MHKCQISAQGVNFIIRSQMTERALLQSSHVQFTSIDIVLTPLLGKHLNGIVRQTLTVMATEIGR